MNFKKVLITYKRSNYEKYIIEDHYRKLKKHPKLSQPLRVSHKNHYASLDEVEKIVKALGIKYEMKVRSEPFKEKDYDLIISVGGDGTFLDASQFLTTTPIVGVNSNPAESVGHFCPLRVKTLHNFLVRKRHPVFLMSRLKVEIDGKVQRPVLNDILFTNIHPASTSRYLIQIGTKKEQQKSSGIWVSTAIGSTAAILGAGGKRMDPESTKYQVKIREPYIQRGKIYTLDKKILPGKTKIKVTSHMRDGMLYQDGTKRVHPFIFGSKVVISATAPKLRVLGFR